MTNPLRCLSLHRPSLRLNYATLALPGGAAAETRVGAPIGVSHLLEHLLYRQNDAQDRLLDKLGGRVGLETRAETIWACMAFDDGAIESAARFFLRGWRELELPAHIVEQEKAVVIDEIAHAQRQPERAIWQKLVGNILPGSHLARDISGRKEALETLTPDELRRIHRDMAELGGAFVNLGPRSLGDSSSPTLPFAPPPVVVSPLGARTREQTRGPPHAIVAAGRALAGRRSAHCLGSYASAALLQFGRLHPSQIAYHTTLAYRFMRIELRMYADVALFAAIARCAPADAARVEELLVDLLENPQTGSDPGRLQRCLQHHLSLTLDEPFEASAEEASRLLVGAPPLWGLEEQARSMDGDAVAAAVRSCSLGPVSTVIFQPVEP